MKYKPTIVTAYYATHGIPAPEYEYRFHPVRKWRFDMAWPDYMVALEVEGGVHVRGRHSRGAGMVKDMEKYNHAIMCGGWFVLRCTPRDVCMLETAEMVKKVLVIRTPYIMAAAILAALEGEKGTP